MKTLRAKLFINIGIIFLLVGIFNTCISEIWIKQELTKAGNSISKQMATLQDRMKDFASFLLTFRIINEAIKFERIEEMPFHELSAVLEKQTSIWQSAARQVSYDPEIAFVQIQNKEGDTAIVCPADAHLHSFSWAYGEDHSLWVKVKNQDTLFNAIPYKDTKNTFYLLFESKLPFPKGLENSFKEVIVSPPSYTWEEKPSSLLHALLLNKQEWFTKITLIQHLLSYENFSSNNHPIGILELHLDPLEGACLLSHELFPSNPIIENIAYKKNLSLPLLILRDTPVGKELDMVAIIPASSTNDHSISIGFSLSSLLKETAFLLNRTVIANGDTFCIGFSPDQTTFDPEKKQFPFAKILKNEEKIEWDGNSFFVSTIDLNILKLFVVTPEKQATAFDTFLEELRETMAFEISLSLGAASLISFALALGFLNNISKKITNPIAALSKASTELGKGNYEGLVLPEIGNRKDEVATLEHSFLGMVRALKDKDKIRGVLNKVVSKEISEQILQQSIELGGEEKIVTLLFSDIRNFTHLAEDIPPHLLIKLLNSYLTCMCRIIDQTHGVVDKFVGDEIMTLYGAPLPLEFHAVEAIQAALWMIEDLRTWNQERRSKKEPTFEIGIGIHTGLVYTGNMGAENRLNYTAIGSNVNQASRICSVALPMQILISENTLQSPGVEEKFSVKKLDPVLLKGIQNPVQVYEVLGRR